MVPKKRLVGPGAVMAAVLLALNLPGLGRGWAQPAASPGWDFLLLDESRLTDDCPVCDRLPIELPMRGGFTVRLAQEEPLATRYALENISFTAGSGPGYSVKGSGSFVIGGEVAVTVEMSLQLEIDNGFTNTVCYLTNSTPVPRRHWPMMDIEVDQTNGTIFQVFHLRLAAAPVREILFSTARPFTAGAEAKFFAVSGGDLISASGQVLKTASELSTAAGAMPLGPDLGLDALDLRPGGELVFSFESQGFSETLGPLEDGDLVSNRGLIRHSADLLSAFDPRPATNDVGLDAVHLTEGGAVWFSVRSNLFSETLDRTLSRGDLLADSGEVVRDHRELLARFHPPDADHDYGLDACYQWPNGEIWFSTEEGFTDELLGAVQAGDLLSDQGYVVFRNLELLSAFAPVEDLADFGLDALWIATDAALPAGPEATVLGARVIPDGLRLSWRSPGRLFQVERAADPAGPFERVGPLLLDPAYDDAGVLTNLARAFYRLREW